MPSFIATLVNSRAFGYLARTILTYMFWASGLAKLLDFNAGVAEMAFFGLEPAPLFNIAVAVTQLGGSALIIANRWTWLGAGALGIFTALTIPIAHPFWTMQEPMKTLEFYVVMEHITVIGALMVVAWKSAPARDAVASPHAALATQANT
ncbi:DoxX family protein [Pararhizobium sp. O133]|uniref:DoxX family protein n=1 Tax=Pararhizobium sp. O133 TaxID=3449278 RepID=UPI003F686973